MKDIRPALRTLLLGDAGVAALVADRVYPIRLPQGVKVASVVYTRISGDTDYKMEGASGYARSRMQVAAWAPTADAATALANKVKDCLSGFTGAVGNPSVFIQGAFCTDERELYDDVVQLYGVMRDYFVHHEEL
ncbi:tail completion protein gp17 [Bradyrhizobium yuanmingense]|uniref:tail completion protein gp17 n=1 Tax=Bradyrhizobium yuanmingense TaxID=108015 RepID=UPI0004B11C71|nr:DUF3168 domain-containing protein [Bradyrhizobium yuanmingense]